MRFPVVHVHCALCGVATVLQIRIDNRMTSEGLSETALQMYASFCRDEGVRFAPPSLNPLDYSVIPATESGVLLAGFAPFYSNRNGITIRDQLVGLQQPYHATISISSAFLQRDGVLQDETLERGVLIDKRNKLMQSVALLEQISCDRAIDQQLFRERQEAAVSRVEDVMLYAFVAFEAYESKIEKEAVQLRQLDEVWRRQCIPWIRTAMEAVHTEKRMLLSSSRIAVVSLHASLGSLEGANSHLCAC